jgi:uncharacterized repeat protein (TIGR02059 family)
MTVTQEGDATTLMNALLGTTTGLSNFSATATGDALAFGTFVDDPFGLTSGIVLSTGKAVDVDGPNDAEDTSDGIGIGTVELTISFDADATADKVYFNYVFGSEEFLEYGGSEFNDSFELLVNGTNLAKLTNGDTTTINNLVPNKDDSSTWNDDFVNNTGGAATNETELDGYTIPLTLEGTLISDATNTITIRIQDVGDDQWDSAVFLQGGSLGTVIPPSDTTPPDAPIAPDMDEFSDTGIFSDDNITNDATPKFNGTAEANSTVTLIGDVKGVVGTTTADGSGNWSIVASNLGEGNQIITVTATDAAGNTSDASSGLAITIDKTAPELISDPVVSGTTLVLTYDEALNGDSNPAGGDFTVNVNGSPVTVSSVDADDTTVTLTLATAVQSTDTVTLSYVVPGSNPIEDIAGNDAIAFSGQSVTNNSAPESNSLINGLGGAAGFGENVLAANDDDSTTAIDITSVFSSGLNFFGTTYNSVFLNNNGNITFDDSLSSFTPSAITGATGNPLIAPYFADVDTEAGSTTATPGGTSTGSNLVYWDLDTANGVVTFTWDDVGYYDDATDLLNAFQMRLIDQGNGDFDIEFRYEDINWTTGDASDGSGGLGGTVARSGWTAGNGTDYYELTQAGDQAGMLDLEDAINTNGAFVDNTEQGVFVWEVRGGGIAKPPSLRSVEISGSTLVLTYDETLDGTSDPATTDFTVNVNGTPVTVSSVDADGTTVTLMLGSEVTSSDTVGISYVVPGSNPIQDLDGEQATAFSDRTATYNSSDTLAPVLQTAEVNGTILVLTYDETLNGDSDPLGSDFTVNINGSPVTVSSVDADGTTVTLTLATAAQPGEEVTVSYSAGSNPIEDAAGNDAESFSDRSGTNNSSDTLAPVLQTAEVNGTTLVLTYDETLNGDSDPLGSDFTVNINGSPVTVSSVDADGTTVTLTLATAAQPGEEVTVSYTAGSNPIEDAAGNDAESFSDRSGTNNPSLGNNAPVFSEESLTLDFAAAPHNGRTIYNANATATDIDGDTLYYSIASGNEDGRFSIDPATGNLKVVDDTLWGEISTGSPCRLA